MAKMTTLRFLLAIIAAQNWHTFQLYVNNASLHGNIDEEIFMDYLKGFTLRGIIKFTS